VFVAGCGGNPDAKRLYDDLLSNYNKLVRPVLNVSDALTVRIKLKLSQLIDVVSRPPSPPCCSLYPLTRIITHSIDMFLNIFSELEESDNDDQSMGRTGTSESISLVDNYKRNATMGIPRITTAAVVLFGKLCAIWIYAWMSQLTPSELFIN
jgi:hypothetical protein